MNKLSIVAVLLAVLATAGAVAREPLNSPPPTQVVRARDLGVPFNGTPGKLNAITDVAGVEVGFTTLISGEGSSSPGKVRCAQA